MRKCSRDRARALPPPFSPLPLGERSTRETRRVRGEVILGKPDPPHPNPLPRGEREFCGVRRGDLCSPVQTFLQTRVIARVFYWPREGRLRCPLEADLPLCPLAKREGMEHRVAHQSSV